MKSFDPTKFTLTTAKPLPVVLLLDTSGSMSGSKIAALNQAVREMLETFQKEGYQDQQIMVSVITFGGGAAIHMAPTAAAQVVWKDLHADGGTPMGEALVIAKKLIEDKNEIPSRAYRPAVVLVSDGQPTDEWQGPLNAFIKEGRSAKCDRMTMAIGSDADESVLSAFIAGTPHPLYRAANAGQIHEFFRRVTMSVSMRASSKTPNEIPGGINLIAMERATATVKPTVKSTLPSASPTGSADDEGFW